MKIIIILIMLSCVKNINNLNSINKGIDDLIKASKNGNTETVNLLIGRGANVNDEDNNGFTELIKASYNGDTEAVKLLIERGAEVDNSNKGMIEGRLFKNMKEVNIERSLLLLHKYSNKINFNIRDNEGNTFLRYASLLNSTDLFDIFLDNKVNRNVLNKRGETPLYYALNKDNFDEEFIWYSINKGCILKPCSFVKDRPLLTLLLPYDVLCHELVYEPLTVKLMGNVEINYEQRCKIKEIINILRLKKEDFDKDISMINFIKNMLIDRNVRIEIETLEIMPIDNEDVNLNIKVFDEIFMHFREEDYWESILKYGLEKAHKIFKGRLEEIKRARPVNKNVLEMNAKERGEHVLFRTKKHLHYLLLLISENAERGYNSESIKFSINQILDTLVCREGSLEAIIGGVRSFTREENNELRDIIGEELMKFRYELFKEVVNDELVRGNIRINGLRGVERASFTPHLLPNLLRGMYNELRIRLEYLDEYIINYSYDRDKIIREVIKRYEERIIGYMIDRLSLRNKGLWNKVIDYISRDIFSGRDVLNIDDFICSSDYEFKKETIKALLLHFGFLK